MLILREVLRWQATEVAELLDTTVASVNSALQRARATLGRRAERCRSQRRRSGRGGPGAARSATSTAFERYDIEALTSLLHEDALQSMPPFDLWLRGRDDIFTWWFGPGIGCSGSRVIPDGRGERLARVRAVQAERRPATATSRGRCR